jgi:thiol-disulfide isomerase/thioredoxin
MIVNRRLVMHLSLIFIAVFSSYFIYDNFIVSNTTTIGIQSGDLLLDQMIPIVDGSASVSFSQFRGSILVIDFMAPWCVPCKQQLSILREVNSIDEVEVISINVDRNYDMRKLMEFGDSEGIEWFFGHNPQSALDYEVAGVPTIIIANQNGIIVHRAYYTTLIEFKQILNNLID